MTNTTNTSPITTYTHYNTEVINESYSMTVHNHITKQYPISKVTRDIPYD